MPRWMMLLIKLLVFLNYQFGLEKSEKAFSRTCNWKINIVWVMLSYVQKRILGSLGPWSTFEPLVWFNLQRYETIWRTYRAESQPATMPWSKKQKYAKLTTCWGIAEEIKHTSTIRLWNQKPKISNLPTSHLTKQ